MALRFDVVSEISRIDPELWNRLSWQASPIMEWGYFYALEKSGSASPERGYRPRHLVLYQDGNPVAVAPLYQRERSWVEFGDGGLLQFLSELTGYPYHVGLLAAVPLTPVPGYQFLCHGSPNPLRLHEALLDYIDFLCDTQKLVTSRMYFTAMETAVGDAHSRQDLHRLLVGKGYVNLKSEYCLWFNRGYRSFDDFLKVFRSSRRHKIKRELRDIAAAGIDIRMVEGREAPESLFDDMYRLYVQTWTKHMGSDLRPFFNQQFFRLLHERFRHRCAFSIASRNGETVAMAIFYHKGKQLYGRYWGAFEDYPFLHFATCYYHPIRYAIGEGYQVLDPGFGGEHKLFRGFEVVPASHYIKFYGDEERKFAYSVLERMQARAKAGEVSSKGERRF